MIELELYCDSYRYEARRIAIDPHCVESITETQRRPPDSGWQNVAIIRMQSGAEHIVYDPARGVAEKIREYRDGENGATPR